MEETGSLKTEPTVIMPDILKLLKLIGISRNKSNHYRKTVIHTIAIILLPSSIFPELLLMRSDKYSFFEKTEALVIAVCMIKVSAKILHRFLTIDEFWALYDELQRGYDLNMNDPYKKSKLQQKAKEAKFNSRATMYQYLTLFVLFNIAPIITYVVLNMLQYPAKLDLPFRAEYFIDVTKGHSFVIAYALQSLSGFFTLLAGIWDATFFTCCKHALALVEFVRTDFENISKDFNESDKFIGNEKAMKQNDQGSKELKDLNKCVKQHVMVIRLVQRVERLFSFHVATECTVAGIISCLSMLHVVYSSDFGTKMSHFSLTFITYGALYVFIYHGQQIYDEASKLPGVLYALPWYEHGTPYARVVALALQRSQRTLGVRCMHFYLLSAPTFLFLLRGSYSYFALLQTMAE